MRHQHPGGLKLTKRLVDYCAFSPHTKVLDVGCGIGTTVSYLREVCSLDACGIDLSKERLEQGKQTSPDLPLLQSAAHCLPFADNTFGGVLAECSLSIMQAQTAVLTELTRILTPGGKLAITDIYCHTAATDTGEYFSEVYLRNILSQLGFINIIWEDHSVVLREFIVRYIWEFGPVEEIWPCTSFPRKKLSYFLLVAEKKAAKG